MKLYVVGALKATMEVESNLPFKIPLLELKWCSGQVGVLPVFATLEEAEEYADGVLIIPITVTNCAKTKGGQQ